MDQVTEIGRFAIGWPLDVTVVNHHLSLSVFRSTVALVPDMVAPFTLNDRPVWWGRRGAF
jgi:hypothetical protein